MKHTSFLVLSAALIACNGVQAQVVTAPVEPPPVAQAPQPTATPAVAVPAAGPESRKDEVRAMEVFLLQALQKGAQVLAQQLKMSDPTSSFTTGQGRARGFVLEGYGIFFDVDVPLMKQSVIWSAQMLQLEADRQNMVRFLANAPPDDPRRKIAEMNLRQIERLMAQQQGGTILLTNPTPAPTMNTEMVAPPGVVTGTTVTVAEGAAPPPSTASMSRALAPQQIQPVQPPKDPDQLYTESVKNALIETMLRYNAFLKIGDDERLTVAASDSEGPQTPGQVADLAIIIISIRGADLAAYRAGKLTREEIWKKVEVREF
jgi:hypothetical protein